MTGLRLSSRTLWLLIALMWGGILAFPAVWGRLDYLLNTDPWFEARIEVLELDRVAYTQIVHRDLMGDWQAWIEVGEDHLCGGYGAAPYQKTPQITKIYSLAYFLGKDCPLPDGPFRVCAAWIHTDSAGYRRSVGPVCSKTVQ